MTTLCQVSANNILFQNSGANHATLTATANTLTLSGAGGNVALAGVGAITSDGTINTTGALTISGAAVATESYVTSRLEGLHWKQAVQAATTANITLSGTQTVDDVALIADDRILVQDQTTGSQNGIYVVAADGWARADDASTSAEVNNMAVFVQGGTTNGNKQFVCNNNTVDLGTTSLTFTEIGAGGGGTYTAGDGLADADNTFSVNVDDTGIEINSDTLRLKDLGVTTAKMAALSKGAILAGNTGGTGVTTVNAGLAGTLLGINASGEAAYLTISGDITMGGSGAAAIASNVIVNDDVKTDAAIVVSKLAGGTFGAGSYSFAGRTINDLGTVTTADINGGTIDGVTIATSDVTVGATKTLDVSGGTLTTSAAQKAAIVNGVGANVDIGAFTFRAQALQADGLTATYIPFASTDGLLVDDQANTSLKYTVGSGTLEATVMTATSDERVKKNIKTIDPEEGLRVINASRGVRFDWKRTGLASAGVVAQEAKKLVPELVNISKGGEGQPDDMHSVNYSGYTGYEIAAIQALLARNDALVSRVEALESQVTGKKRKASRGSSSSGSSGSSGGDKKR